MYTCEFCGANLDAGEKCDCRKEVKIAEVRRDPQQEAGRVDNEKQIFKG